MFFSVVVPVYKVEQYLCRCVNSILSQTFNDFELILIDDGSPNFDAQICDEFIKKDNRITILHKYNQGASCARNYGISFASGQYIVFLDSDDLFEDNNALLEIYKSTLNKGFPDLICYGTTLYNENNDIIKKRIPCCVYGNNFEKLKSLVYRNEFISPAYVKSISTTFVKNNNLYFINGVLSGEDIEWSGRILEYVNSIDVCPKSLYKRIRRTEGSITANIGKKNINDILESIEIAVERIKLLKTSDDYKFVFYEYWAYQYAMLFSLLHYISNEKDYRSFIVRLKNLNWLLKFHHVKKVKFVWLLVKFFGVKNTILILDFREKI